MPSVSVGLPVYNGEKLLTKAIESHLEQTAGDLELVICDNASTDATEDICRHYANLDQRVKYHRHDVNIGAADNFRRVFELSSGEYYKWAAVDDYCDARFIAETKKILERQADVVVACTNTYIVDADDNLEVYAPNQALMQESPGERFIAFFDQDQKGNSVYGLMRSAALRRTQVMGRYPGSDIVLMAEMALHGKFCEVPEPLFYRRVHEEASTYDFTFEKQRRFYTPEKKRNLLLPLYSWRLLFEHAASVMRAPISRTDKLSALKYIGRMVRWKRVELLKELKVFSKHLVAGA